VGLIPEWYDETDHGEQLSVSTEYVR
jgi:hypothetical protein